MAVSSFGKRIDGPGGRRWIQRKRVGISASALFSGETRSVLIQDLSLTGAKLSGRDLPAPGTDVALKVGERSLSGRIAWEAGEHRGVRFDFGQIA
jgi:hypothetical protein